MLGVPDVAPDVVQQRPVLEPLALGGRQLVEGVGLVEDLERQPRHVRGVKDLGVAAPQEPVDAARAHVPVDGHAGLAVPGDVVEQQPLAQPPFPHDDGVGPGALQDPGEQQAARHRDVPAPRVQARNPELLLLARAAQEPVHLLQGRTRQGPVTRRVGLAAQDRRLVNEGERLDRPRRAHARLEALLAHRLGRAFGHGADRLLHFPDVLLRGRVALGMAVGQAHDAERQALRQEHARAVGDDELRGPAADVHEEEGVVGGGELAPHGEVDEARFLFARDHVHAKARAFLDRLDELVRVRRFPDGAGGDGPHDLRARARRQLGEVLDRRDAGLDRLGRQAPGAQGLGAEAHHRLLAQHHVQGAVLLDVGDEELDAVGADVDRGQRPHAGHSLPLRRRDFVKAA